MWQGEGGLGNLVFGFWPWDFGHGVLFCEQRPKAKGPRPEFFKTTASDCDETGKSKRAARAQRVSVR